MTPPLTCCARLPADALALLARWRDRSGLRVLAQGDQLWVFWSADQEAVGRHLLALPGADLAFRHDGHWRRPNERLPLFDVPDPESAGPLDRLVMPPPLPRDLVAAKPITPLAVALRRDQTPRRTTALRVGLAALARWADAAVSDDIEAVEAAYCGDEVLLRGRLPALPAERFWGRQVLIPAGWRPEPALAEEFLAEALRLRDEYALFTTEGVEVIPADRFGPASRASIRLAAKGRR